MGMVVFRLLVASFYGGSGLSASNICEWSFHGREKIAHPEDTKALIDCINEANQDEKDNIIDLDDKTFILTDGLPTILSDCDHKLTIRNGRILRSRKNDIPPFRLLHIEEKARFISECVTLENGVAVNSCGGAIFNEGSLEIERSVIADNQAATGGGICNLGFISQIDKTTISSNISANVTLGGGIYNKGYIIKLSNNTLVDNEAGQGGGIYNEAGIEKIINNTISGNQAEEGGGGIYTSGHIDQISNNTIVENNSNGIYNNHGVIDKLISNILANNENEDIVSAGAGSILKNATYNFVERAFPITIANNQIDGPGEVSDHNNIFGLDITLHPLANNGGPTATHAVLLGTAVINNGANPDNLRFDQRGWPFYRAVDNQIDIGSYELQ